MQNIVVNYEYTNNLYKAKKWLNSLPDLFAADFEVASKYTNKEKDILKYSIDNYTNIPFADRRIWLQKYNSNGLSHPGLTCITHLSVAWSNTDAYVIICDASNIRQLIYYFLTTTNKTQIWHNSIYDFRHILFHTGTVPDKYIDTQLLAKCLINDANPLKDKIGLKELMEYAYGEWAISKDDFTLEEMWNKNTIKYAATDACATFMLYEDIQEEINKWKI